MDVDGSQFYQSPQHDVSALFVSFTYKLTQNMDSGLCLWLVFDRCNQSKLETKLVLILPATAKDAVQYKRPAEFENMLVCGHITTPVDMNEVPPQIRSQEPDQDTQEWKTRLGEIIWKPFYPISGSFQDYYLNQDFENGKSASKS